MPFFLARGKRVFLMHGFRNHKGDVRHRRLHTFVSRGELAQALGSDGWTDLQERMAESHPDIGFDWVRLRDQAEQLSDAVPPPAARDTDERILELRRLLYQLRRRLDGLRFDMQPADRAVYRGVAYDLREFLYGENLRLFIELSDADNGKKRQRVIDTFYPLFYLDPDGALVEEARAVFHSGRHKAASKLFEQARQADPIDPDVYISEGICWMQVGDFARAETLFRQAAGMARHMLPLKGRTLEWGDLESRPYLRARYNLGLALEQLGRIDEAMALWEDCLAISPQDAIGAAYALGPAYHRQGQLQEAISIYQRSLDIPGAQYIPDAQYNLAAALLAQGRMAEGSEQLLAAFLTNHYIPAVLLGERPLPQAEVWSNMQDLEWADHYKDACGDLWTTSSLRLLAELWHAPEVREAIGELRALQRAMRGEPVGDSRSELATASVARERRLLPTRVAEQLVSQVAGDAPRTSARPARTTPRRRRRRTES